MTLDSKLAETLDVVARLAAKFEEPWWIIGSAAAALLGADEDVADVDILVGEKDARRLLEGGGFTPVASPLFHSDVFGRLAVAPLPIEIMAGLHVRGEPLLPTTRLEIRWREATLYVPDLPEQIAILELFGRDKDLGRARRLQSFSSCPNRGGPSGRSDRA